MTQSNHSLSLLQDLVAKAKSFGATDADAVLWHGVSQSAAWREGKTETVEQSETSNLSLRIFIGNQTASVSSSDINSTTFSALAERAVAMAKAAPEDPFCGLASPAQIAHQFPHLDMADVEEPSTTTLIEQARAAEDAAKAVPGVTMCDGANASFGKSTFYLVATNGFAGERKRTGYHLSIAALAGQGTGMEHDYDSASAIFRADLPSPEVLGKSAGERVVKRLGARQMPTAQISVVYDPRVATSLLGHLASAINGATIARKTSFWLDSMNQRVVSEGVNVIDDPFRPRGLRSRAFDGEGILPEKRTLVENGILRTWLLDCRAARQLNLQSTGHASHSSGGPSPSNLFIENGSLSPQQLMSDIKNGLYITDLMGMGVNGLTGDYSRGASGFWIENGQIAFPVNEVTIAGNLKEMFLHLTPANDLVFKHGIDCPTLRIDGMTLAGL